MEDANRTSVDLATLEGAPTRRAEPIPKRQPAQGDVVSGRDGALSGGADVAAPGRDDAAPGRKEGPTDTFLGTALAVLAGLVVLSILLAAVS